MSSDAIRKDPAFPAMTMDILNNVLSRADNPVNLVHYLTEELRELTGARCVQFIQSTSGAAHRVIDVNPPRCNDWATSAAAIRLYEIINDLPGTQLLRPDDSSEASGLLREAGFGLSIAVPLHVGDDRVGAMLLLGLPDNNHLETEIKLLNTLSTVVALVLRTAFLFENQEQVIKERTVELENSQTLLKAVVEGTTDIIFVKDQDSRYLLANDAATKLFGLTADEIIGKDAYALMPDQEARITIAHDQEVFADAVPHTFEETVTAKDGLAHTFLATKGPLFDDKGTVIGLFSISRDITERKQSERILEHKLDLLTSPIDSVTSIDFNDLFDLEEIQKIQDSFALATGVASIITDTSGQPITKPSNFCDLCLNIIRTTEKGLAHCHHSDAVLGRLNLVGPVIQPCLSGGLMDGGAAIHVGGHHVANWLVGQVLDESCDIDAMMAYAQEIGAEEDEYREALSRVNRMSKGQFENVCNALFQIAGQLSGMAIQNVKQAQYITERKRAEVALHASERRFRELLENVQLVAITLDAEGTITFCNDFLSRLSGWSKEEIIGTNWFDLFIPADDQHTVKTVFTQGIAEGNLVAHFENPIITRAGGLRSIVWDNSMLHNPDNSIVGVACVGIDVTEHRHLEEQLRQSQKMEAVGQLAGGVAHDFNNILQVIMGYGNMLLVDTRLDEQQKGEVEQIISASEKAAQLTRGLLAFSRKQIMDPRMANLNDIVQHAQNFLVRIIGEDINFKSILNTVYLPVKVDSSQIEQVLINLATNARDAMPKGGLLTIETGFQEIDAPLDDSHGYGGPGCYAWIAVSDTGSGMDEETRIRIFEPFFTTKEVGKGTGLGMAIVYGIVRQHNGFINVYSEPGHGTTFRVYIPLVATEQTAQGEKAAQAPPHGGTETILLAEDDASVRKLMVSVLTKYGYEVIQAEDGGEAVEKFAANRERIRLILMDMIMPKKNGKEAYEEIRKIEPDARVLYSSGYTADFIQSRGVIDEGIELIMKPVQPLELLRKVREILDR